MKRIYVVENKKARVEFKMEEITIGEINGMYKALTKANKGWETKEYTYSDNEVEQ